MLPQIIEAALPARNKKGPANAEPLTKLNHFLIYLTRLNAYSSFNELRITVYSPDSSFERS